MFAIEDDGRTLFASDDDGRTLFTTMMVGESNVRERG